MPFDVALLFLLDSFLRAWTSGKQAPQRPVFGLEQPSEGRQARLLAHTLPALALRKPVALGVAHRREVVLLAAHRVVLHRARAHGVALGALAAPTHLLVVGHALALGIALGRIVHAAADGVVLERAARMGYS